VIGLSVNVVRSTDEVTCMGYRRTLSLEEREQFSIEARKEYEQVVRLDKGKTVVAALEHLSTIALFFAMLFTALQWGGGNTLNVMLIAALANGLLFRAKTYVENKHRNLDRHYAAVYAAPVPQTTTENSHREWPG